MSKKKGPAKRRWECADPDHPGILAPARMRAVDIRRYCIPCSERAGVLVQRRCPSLEREREEKAEQRRAKARRATASRQKRRQARVREAERRRAAKSSAIVEAVGDLHAELERIWPLARAVSPRDDLPEHPPELKIQRRARTSFVSGYAWYEQHRLFVGVPRSADHAEGVGTLAHEVAHLICADRDRGHHPAFWRTLVDLIQEAYDAEISLESVIAEPRKYLRQKAVEQSIRVARERAGL